MSSQLVAGVAAEAAAVEEHALPRRHRFLAQVAEPRRHHRVDVECTLVEAREVEQQREPDHGAAPVADHPEAARRAPPPPLEDGDRARRVVAHGDVEDRVAVLDGRGLDGVPVLARREERLPDGRVLQQVEEVGGVAPELGAVGVRHLGAQPPPGGAPVGPMRRGIGLAQPGRDRLLDALVEHQAVPHRLDEGEPGEQGVGVGGTGLAEHGGEERAGHPADHRGGFDEPACPGGDLREVEADEALEHPGDRHRSEVGVGALAGGGGADAQRQRMATGHLVQPRRLVP